MSRRSLNALRLLTIMVCWPLSTVASAVSVGLCPGHVAPQHAVIKTMLYSPQGQPQTFVVMDNKESLSDCRRRVLSPDDSAGVLWAGPVDAEQHQGNARTLILQGQFSDDNTVISEVITGEALAAPRRSFHAFNQSLVGQFDAQVFGAEERARMEGDNILRCHAGQQVAGVLLDSQRQWLPSSSMALSVTAEGDGEFTVALGNPRHNQDQAPHVLGTLSLSPGAPQRVDFSVPEGDSPWTTVTLVCPAQAAEMQIHDLRMTLPTRAQHTTRGAWFWTPNWWQQEPDVLWRSADSEHLDELFISIPVTDSRVQQPQQLAAFVRAARQRGIAVWAVIGDPRDVLETSWPAMQERLTAYRHFNQHADTAAQLAGVQLDIEPYLLPGFALNHGLWRQRYIDTIQVAQDTLAGALPLDLVVPSWWGIHPQWGEQLFDQLNWRNARMTVMNYHTDPQRLQHDAEPFLSWAQNNGVTMHMALEAGSLSDETQQRFRRSEDRGELWLFPSTEPATTPAIMVLFDRPQEDLGGIAYRYSHSTVVPSERYTFNGDMAHLQRVAKVLQAHWQQWPSFGGISLHGLDEHAEPK